MLTGALATAGCGLGAGSTSAGTATLTVTRDYGEQTVADATEDDPSESDTVLRMLDRTTDITTRYGGGFVQSIDGLAGATDGTRRSDWFFYVNGIESPVGSTQVRVHGGDRIWWDYRDWTDAMRVPAVVGSYPQPFAASGSARVGCAGPPGPCETVANELRDQGVEATVRPGPGHSGSEPRVLVGPWDRIGDDPAAAQVEAGPASSGVFASFDRADRLHPLDVQGRALDSLGADAGLVAAVRLGDDAPTWLVTGTGAQGVRAAAALVDEDSLRDRYAIAVSGNRQTPLPVQGAEDSG